MQFETQLKALATSLVVGASLLLWYNKRNANQDSGIEEQFLASVMANDLEAIRKLIPKKAKLRDVADQDKNTALIIALKSGHVEAAKLLKNEFGLSLEAVNKDGWNCFLSACFGGSLELVELVHAEVPRLVNEANFDGWTGLQIAATKGFEQIAQFAVEKGANVNAKNAAGQTSVLISACNGYEELVKYLVAHGADPTLKTEKLETSLLMAIKGGQKNKGIIEYLLSIPACSEKDFVNASTNTGSTALHLTAKVGLPEIADLLIEKGADVNAQERDGSSPLHAAIIQNHVEMVKLLLNKDANTNTKTRFGTTPLHDAAFYGRPELVRLLLEKGADMTAKDNDGLTPLHITCTVSPTNRGNTKDGDYIGVLNVLLEHKADVNTFDEGKSNPLFIAALAKEKGLSLVPLLLENGANYTQENWQGWTPLHAAYSKEGNPGIAEAIEAHARVHNPDFLSTFDKNKPRILGRRNNNPNYELAKAVFGDAGPSLEAIAERISSGQSTKIVVLLGAGISVSAGIPDFRNPDSGIYSQATAKKYKLENPAAAFDLGALRQDPAPFYRLIKDIFYPVVTGAIKPTATHKFLKLLKDRNVLSRVYTQNIDALEYPIICIFFIYVRLMISKYTVGLDESDVIEAHGSFKKALCMTCKKPADIDKFWAAVDAESIPKCEHCGDTVRPGVVFFGEALPSRFFEFSMADLRGCDLLIVMGTSLKVYPFASLVNDVSPSTPRLLFNREEVGPFKGCAVNLGVRSEKDTNVNKSPRDLAWIGDCDDGVKKLASLLGWDL